MVSITVIETPELFVILIERAFIILDIVQIPMFIRFVVSTHTVSDAGGV